MAAAALYFSHATKKEKVEGGTSWGWFFLAGV